MIKESNLSLKVSSNATRTMPRVTMARSVNVSVPTAAESKAEKQESFDSLVSEVSHLASTLMQPPVAGPTPIVQPAETTLRQTGRMLMLGDIIALTLSFIVGGAFFFLVKNYAGEGAEFTNILSFGTLQQFLVYMGLGGAALLWLDQQGHYRQRLPFWEVTGHIVGVSLVGLIIGGFVQFAMKQEFSRLWLALSWLMMGAFIFAGRVLMKRYLRSKNAWNIPVLMLGTGPTAQAARHVLKTEGGGMGYWIMAQLSAERMAGLTQPDDWHRLMQASGTTYIVLALEGSALEQYQPMIRAIVRAHIPYTIVPPWHGLPSSGMTPHSFFTHDVVMLHNTNRLTLPLPRLIKRTFDVVMAGGAVLALSPLFLILALLVKRDGGPAFLVNYRIGHNGRTFGCLKFRSMVQDNDRILQEYLESNPAAAEEWRKFQKLTHDPRITKFGHFIRKTSLDELPQLWNVVRGDMSLVGPRPILPNQSEMYGDDFSFYTAVRPGITGPWQVSGRNKLTIAQRVHLESWYARNWSLWMDIVILMKTIPTLMGKGSKAV